MVFDPSQGSKYRGVKRAWSYLKLLQSESIGISALFWNNRVCTSNKAKAEALPKHYQSVFTKERLESLLSMSSSPFSDMPDICFSVLGIKKQLVAISPDKACNPDLIPPQIICEAATERHLFRLRHRSYIHNLSSCEKEA